nr:S26 family signal peptidase [Sphingopyxis sp. PET50]
MPTPPRATNMATARSTGSNRSTHRATRPWSCRSFAKPCRTAPPTTRSTWASGPKSTNSDPMKCLPSHLFLMGDNRDGSADSRVPVGALGLGGAVPFDVIVGRAEIITFSTDGSAQWYNPVSWFRALRSGRAGTDLTPERKGQ